MFFDVRNHNIIQQKIHYVPKLGLGT